MLKGYYIVIFGVDKILSPCPGGGEKDIKDPEEGREAKGKEKGKEKGGKRGEGGMVGRGRKGSG